MLPDPKILLPDDPPDIIEFATSPRYLGRKIYPRQATLLKAIFLQSELFTSYDMAVLEEWATMEFRLPPKEGWDVEKPYRFVGMAGIQPDILERVDINRADGRKWFREVLAVIGRRGGKGYIGAISGAYVMWHYLCHVDPQEHYSIAKDKRLAALVFAGKKLQAVQNQWRDLVNVIIAAPCFQPFISQSLGESLTVHSKVSLGRREELAAQGVHTSMDLASFEVLPKEATTMAGRGPAAYLLFFDEMAHVIATGASRSAEELYTTATPALDQFGVDGFIYAGSSPWQMIGQFYDLCQDALQVELDTLEPVYPEKLLVQLTSWDIYKDYERAHKIMRVPGTDKAYTFLARHDPSPKTNISLAHHYVFNAELEPVRAKAFDPIDRPIQAYDDQMKRLERANPDTFAVERRSRWASVLDTYLNADLVDRMFEPYDGFNLRMQDKGVLANTYVAHGDPSYSNANFGWAIAHRVGPDADGLYHVVFDKVHFWAPWSFDDGRVDYIQIEKEIVTDLINFVPSIVTFDQFSSGPIMAQIRQEVHKRNLPKRVTIDERTATAPQNWAVAECFKTALGMNLIHSPYQEQLELECKFLQRKSNRVDHPTMGPVQTKDVFDAVSNCVFTLIGQQMEAFMEGFRGVGIHAVAQSLDGSSAMMDHDREIHQRLSSSLRRTQGLYGGASPTRRSGWRP